MQKIVSMLDEHFGIACTGVEEVHGGLSAMNYRIAADGQSYFLKVYDKKKTQVPLWTANIDCYMPILEWLNGYTGLRGRIVRPIRTKGGSYRYDDEKNVFLLFDYIEGDCPGKILTHAQLLEAAEIMACLHDCGGEVPVNTQDIREDFSISFCFSLERFISKDYVAAPADIKDILQPCLPLLMEKNGEVMLLSKRIRQKNVPMVLCHTDAHGYNLMQSERLVLVDWEGIKMAPAEADLVMFTKKEYWDVFFGRYRELRPGFVLDDDVLLFYILRRKIEDIWAFIEGILLDDLPPAQRERDLGFLSACCNSLDELWFEL